MSEEDFVLVDVDKLKKVQEQVKELEEKLLEWQHKYHELQEKYNVDRQTWLNKYRRLFDYYKEAMVHAKYSGVALDHPNVDEPEIVKHK